MFTKSLLNMILRGLTVAGKFLLVFGMTRYLSLEQVGEYGLVTAAISIAIYVLGLDFYTYNTREIVSRDQAGQAGLIRDQLVFHGLVYLVVLPALWFIFINGILSWKQAGWFYLILICEHLAQELNRVLVALSRSTKANVVLFVRSGVWIAPVILGLIWSPHPDLQIIWLGWATGGVCSLLLGGYFLGDLPWRQTWHQPVNWVWIKTAIRGTLPFFAATVVANITAYSDRFLIQHFLSKSLVGVYFFYISTASLIVTFVDVGIVQPYYADILDAYQKGWIKKYHFLMRKIFTGIIVLGLLLAGLLLLGLGPLLNLVGKAVYREHLEVFQILVISNFISLMGMITYISLYVRRIDQAFLLVNSLALIISLTSNLILLPKIGLVGAAIAHLLVNSIIPLTMVIIFRTIRSSVPNHETC